MVNNGWIVHHGVKGMKWGVRHDPITFGRGRRGNDIYKKQQNNQKKGLTPKQKKIIGAVAVGAALAAVGYVGMKKVNKINTKIAHEQISRLFNDKYGSVAYTKREVGRTTFDLKQPLTNKWKISNEIENKYFDQYSNIKNEYLSKATKMAKNDKLSTKIKNVNQYRKNGNSSIGLPTNYAGRVNNFNMRTNQETLSQFNDRWNSNIRKIRKAHLSR